MSDASSATQTPGPFENDLSDVWVTWIRLPYRLPEGYEIQSVLDHKRNSEYSGEGTAYIWVDYALVELAPLPKNRAASRGCEDCGCDCKEEKEQSPIDLAEFLKHLPDNRWNEDWPEPLPPFRITCDDAHASTCWCHHTLGGTE